MATWDVTTAGAKYEHDPVHSGWNDLGQIDANHFILTARASDGFAYSLEINTSTWAITTVGGPRFEFNTSNLARSHGILVDTNHFIVSYEGQDGGDGVVSILETDTSTWLISTATANFHIDTQKGQYFSITRIDDEKFLHVWSGTNSLTGRAQVVNVNSSTYAVSTAGAVFGFVADETLWQRSVAIDSRHHLVMTSNDTSSQGEMNVLEINTTTYEVTTASAPFVFEGGFQTLLDFMVGIDTNHFIGLWGDATVANVIAQVFTVNTSTWAVTTAGATFTLTGAGGNARAIPVAIDSNHFITIYQDSVSGDGFSEVLEVDTSTWTISTVGTRIEFDTQDCVEPMIHAIDGSTGKFIIAYRGFSTDGFSQILNVEMPPTGPANLSSFSNVAKASISTLDTTAIGDITSINSVA